MSTAGTREDMDMVTYTVTKGSRIVEQGTVTADEFLRIRRVWTMSLGANKSRYTVTCQAA